MKGCESGRAGALEPCGLPRLCKAAERPDPRFSRPQTAPADRARRRTLDRLLAFFHSPSVSYTRPVWRGMMLPMR